MYEKILIPLDGSELAEVVLPYAEELAGRLSSEVTLLSVSESADTEHYHEVLTYIEEIAKRTKRGVERNLVKPVEKEIRVDSKVLVGHPAEEIVDCAEKEDFGLIVMATHGRSGIRRWALGSVADKVVRASKRPVALIRAKGARPDVRERGALNKVLVPLDGSKEGEVVVPHIEELASKLKAEVILFQAVAQAYHAVPSAEYAEVPYTKEEMEPLKASAKGYLEKVASRLENRGFAIKSEARIGTAAEEIVKLADEINADVVAMSTHGRSGISRWELGSVADKVLHAGNTPLLLVRASGARTEH